MALAYAVAAVHAAAVVVLLIGALLAVRWPRVLLVHLPVAIGILAVNRAGADCPLTTFELWLRARAGREGYDGGFLHHYAFEPVGIDITGTPALFGVYAAAVLPTVIGYCLLVARTLRRRREADDEPSRSQRLGGLCWSARSISCDDEIPRRHLPGRRLIHEIEVESM